MAEADVLCDYVSMRMAGENEWMIVKNSGVKRAKVGNEQQFRVGVRFTSNDVFPDLFAVLKMAKD